MPEKPNQTLAIQSRKASRAVAEVRHLGVHAVEYGNPEVVQRRFFAVFDVPARLDRAAAAAGEQNRQVVVIVGVAVGVAAAVDDHAVVQQRAVALLDALQLRQQVGELLDVELVDVADLRLLLLVAAVVRQVVVAFRDADERVRLVAALVRVPSRMLKPLSHDGSVIHSGRR